MARAAFLDGDMASFTQSLPPESDVDGADFRTHAGETFLHRLAGHPARVTAAQRPFTVEMATFLLDRGADVNARDVHELTPLHHAAEALDQELRRTALPHRAEAAKDMIRLLLARGADATLTDARGETPIAFVGADRPAGKFIADEVEALIRAKNRAALKEGAQGTRLPEDIEGRISAFLGGRRKKTRARKTKRRLTRRRK